VRLERGWLVAAQWLWRVDSSVARHLRSAFSRRSVRVAAGTLATLILIPLSWVVYHVYFDRSRLPDIEPFLRFEPPRIGEVFDARGTVLIELAREFRRVVSYDEVPAILRQAVLAAEDKNFFSHSGVDYSALPRVIRRTAVSSLAAWWADGEFRLLLPQGGSTLTQQLVRGYFLHERTSQQDGEVLFNDGTPERMLAKMLGVPATNKLLRKLEEVRLSLWLEEEMLKRYGSKEKAKREIFARCVSFHYVGNNRYGLAAGSEYYFGKVLSTYTEADAGNAALLAGIGKSPADYVPAPGNQRALRRRNQILALMERNGYIPESVARKCQAEPIRLTEQSPRKTAAPAAIGHVFAELNQHGSTDFGVEALLQGRIAVRSTVDYRVQVIVNEALENGLALYEKRHPESKGLIQGSVIVLRNADAAILAEVGGREHYEDRDVRYSDLNRVTSSLRQPGSAMKPLVYLAAFRQGLTLDTTVPDEPIGVSMGEGVDVKWIANYDKRFKGPISMRQALAESRNAVAVWIAREIGPARVIRTARLLGIRSPLQPYLTIGLGLSEVRLMELAGAYRAIASGLDAEPHVIDRVADRTGRVLYEADRKAKKIQFAELSLIQEGLRGVVRLPNGTASALNRQDFPIQVMGKTGTTSDFRDALFVGSTHGPEGITVAVRVGFDDNRELGAKETGGRLALPIFREIMLRVYQAQLFGPAPTFPPEIEKSIDDYLARRAASKIPPAPAESATPDPAPVVPALSVANTPSSPD
jgi:penicillin-binding protein 1A